MHNVLMTEAQGKCSFGSVQPSILFIPAFMCFFFIIMIFTLKCSKLFLHNSSDYVVLSLLKSIFKISFLFIIIITNFSKLIVFNLLIQGLTRGYLELKVSFSLHTYFKTC